MALDRVPWRRDEGAGQAHLLVLSLKPLGDFPIVAGRKNALDFDELGEEMDDLVSVVINVITDFLGGGFQNLEF